MNDVAIQLTNVTKRFKLYHSLRTGPIKERLLFWRARDFYREFMAVRNVSLKIQRGEIIGVCGPNGAGKTTLLKMIAGLLSIDSGSLEVHGKVTALLALGVGVNPEFTGRENVLYTGLLLGMSKREIMRKMPEIIDFAELGDFIDQPFRTYSSGMRSRLLFATSMSVDPDIFIIDEALSTADATFVMKCKEKVRQLCNSGATVLFVSHNVTEIRDLCPRALLMLDGQLVVDGPTEEALAAYTQWVVEREAGLLTEGSNAGLHPTERSTGGVSVTSIVLLDGEGAETNVFPSGGAQFIRIRYRCDNSSRSPLYVMVGILAGTSKTYIAEVESDKLIDPRSGLQQCIAVPRAAEAEMTLRFDPLLLSTNRYSLWIMFYTREPFAIACEYKDVAPFFVGKMDAIFYSDVYFRHPAQIESTITPSAGSEQ